MNSTYKLLFTNLNKEEMFNSVIKKITLKQTLNESEWSFALTTAMLFFKKYSDEANESLFQFGYYIVLSYYLSTGDYRPLYYASINAGFFPISEFLKDRLNTSLEDYLISNRVKGDYTENNLIYLKEQKEVLDSFIDDNSNYKTLIAPTSYGKSKFIGKDIEKNGYKKKIGVIVPTKALIWQTFNNLKEIGKKNKCRVLLHDSEYNGESDFIGIFTQERALRLIENNDIYFDTLYIDEAHNLFEKDEREILLARLIRINKKKNPNQRVIYLSPLVNDSSNFKLESDSIISESRINKSIKEYDVYYFGKDRKQYAYNRFVNEKYKTNKNFSNEIDYIFKNSNKKNLIYFYSPKKIEAFAFNLINNKQEVKSKELEQLADLIESYSDKDYLLVQLIRRGIIYIHSKVPDFIKDFLYDRFNSVDGLTYLISNGCVLEGVDFQIDCLFIMDTYSLDEKKTFNLIGRVNRLKSIFRKEATNLNKVMCPIHYVDTHAYCSGAMHKKMEYLRSNIKDSVENPILVNTLEPKSDEEKAKNNLIKQKEKAYLDNEIDDLLVKAVIKNGVDKNYIDYNKACVEISKRLNHNHKINSVEELVKTISSIFVSNHELGNKSRALERMNNLESAKYYYNYLTQAYYGTLKSKIAYIKGHINYLKQHPEKNGNIFVGTSFGNTSLYNNPNDHFTAYIDSRNLSVIEETNVSIVKSKVEDDFIDYELIPYVKLLLDLNVITEDLYNEFVYGVKDNSLVSLYKTGFSSQLIKFIISNNLISEIQNVGYGFLVSDKFLSALENQDELIKFEIKKFIVN